MNILQYVGSWDDIFKIGLDQTWYCDIDTFKLYQFKEYLKTKKRQGHELYDILMTSVK